MSLSLKGSTDPTFLEKGVTRYYEYPVQGSLAEQEKEKERAADRMAEEMRKEKDKDRLMQDKFRELLDDAKKKDDGSRPIKDIDLD